MQVVVLCVVLEWMHREGHLGGNIRIAVLSESLWGVNHRQSHNHAIADQLAKEGVHIINYE